MNTGFVKYLMAAAMAAMAACVSSPVSISDGRRQAIEFRAAKPAAQTRGEAIVTNKLPVGTTVSVWGMYYPGGGPADMSEAEGAFGWKNPISATIDAQSRFSYGGGKVWPTADDDRMRFFAIYPQPYMIADEDELDNLTNEEVVGKSTLFISSLYTLIHILSEDVSNHQDLLLAVTDKMAETATVELQFRHLLTKVDFKARKADGFGSGSEVIIENIIIKTPPHTLLTTIDGEGVISTRVGQQPNFEVIMSNTADGEAVPVLTGAELTGAYANQMNYINGTSGARHYALMIPIVADNYFASEIPNMDAMTVEIEARVDGVLKTYTMPLHESLNRWEAGKQITYLITLSSDGTSIESNYIVEDWNDVEIDADISQTVLDISTTRVEINDYNRARIYFWTNYDDVHVSDTVFVGNRATWTEVDADDYFYDMSAGGDNMQFEFNQATGLYQGWIDIMTDRKYAGIEDIGAVDKKVTLYIEAGGVRKAVEVNIKIESTEMIVWDDNPYAGAFWRHDQTGERVIAGYGGSEGIDRWEVSVEYPAGGPTGWVVLSNKKSLDADMWTSTTPGDPENYPVEGGEVSDEMISGYNPMVNFRVGTTGTIGAGEVRYARLNLRTYEGLNALSDHVIWLRQGEAADYVMRPEDNAGSAVITTEWGGTADTPRPLAAKWSTYNLTAQGFKNGSVAEKFTFPPRSGRFVDYPTQAGAHFQWGESGGIVAYNPVAELSEWIGEHLSRFWSEVKKDMESCPEGYRRPDMFNNEYVYTSMIATPDQSELLQSLFLNILNEYPYLDASYNPGNLSDGYYADGFFDRRPAEMAEGGNAANNSAVNADSPTVGYIGMVIYNPTTFASLFFPFSGIRYDSPSTMAGYGAYYLTTGKNMAMNFYPWAMGVAGKGLTAGANAATVETPGFFPMGMSIRCVASED